MNEVTLPVQEILALLWRRRALIGIVFGAGVATVIVLAWLQPPTYRATAKLMVTSARATMTVSPDANERPRVDPVTDSDLGAEVAMLGSKPLLREVLEPHQAELDNKPAPTLFGRALAALGYPLRLPGRIYRAIHGLPPASPLDEWVDDMSRKLMVSTVGRSTLIEVSFEDAKPAWAAEVVNSVVTHHLDRHVRMNQQASAQQFYESQREVLTGKLREAEEARRAFYEREGIEAVGQSLPVLRKRVGQLQGALADAETGLAESGAEADYLSQALQAMPRNVVASVPGGRATGADLIQSRLLELELQRSQLLSQYAPSSMKVADVDRQLAEARRLLDEQKERGVTVTDPTRQGLDVNLTQARARVAALQARIAALHQQLDESQQQLTHLESIASEQDKLEQEVSAAKASLATYTKKEEEARFSNALDESRIVNISVVDRAAVPTTPEPSKRSLTIALGAIVSMAAGLGLAFVRDRLDPSVKSASEARRLTGIPVLAEIPS
ncbi:MAG TPA: GumC family protein [Candidatus Dormibacteraeota bacterium]|nr:GumC family protein [Candidatus Dormibacteraeota bacterium]